MLPVRAVLVDFDGTASLDDVSEVLLQEFGDPGWPLYDELVDRGEMGLREAGRHQSAMLSGGGGEMLALPPHPGRPDPTFPPFVGWAGGTALAVTPGSDGV